jgi:hypothetical protein
VESLPTAHDQYGNAREVASFDRLFRNMKMTHGEKAAK